MTTALTTKDLLANLNILRAANNLKPLKAWKESRAKLEAAIAKLPAPKPAEAPKTETKKAKPAGKHTEGLISIKQIAADLGMDAKVARAKLRRAFTDAQGTGKDDAGQSDTRWMFTDEQVVRVKSILTGDKRKK